MQETKTRLSPRPESPAERGGRMTQTTKNAPAQRVDLVDEDDCRRLLARELKQVLYEPLALALEFRHLTQGKTGASISAMRVTRSGTLAHQVRRGHRQEARRAAFCKRHNRQFTTGPHALRTSKPVATALAR
jgi:hypothetical protein